MTRLTPIAYAVSAAIRSLEPCSKATGTLLPARLSRSSVGIFTASSHLTLLMTGCVSARSIGEVRSHFRSVYGPLLTETSSQTEGSTGGEQSSDTTRSTAGTESQTKG